MNIISRKEAKAQGLARYFTGKPCKNGHIAERLTAGHCVECHRANHKQWVTQNPEKFSEAVKRFSESGKAAAGRKDWRNRNPQKVAQWSVERRKRKLNNTTETADKEAILAIYAERDHLNREAGYIAYHVDHIQPLAKGGAHHPDNLQILPAEENWKKGAKVA